MAYIGLQPQTKTVATSTQTLTGNGVDLEYSLNRAVSKAADILVFVGNTVQVPESDYTAFDNTLLFASGKTPANAAVISINYKAGALTTTFVSSNSYPVGTTVNPSIRSVDAASTGIYFPTTTSVGITVAGNTRLKVTNQVSAIDTASGALQVVGGVGISDNMVVGGPVAFVDSSSSGDTTTGALTVNGGVGVAENLNVGGDLNVAGDFTVAGQFTTTGADSLAVNDPFIFLANANPGDNLDTGFISSYNDGSDQRYTGIFRDITDGNYKLFDNLLTQPSTVVDTANVSYRAANLVVGNIIATNLFGTVQGATTITTVGNLSSLSVAGTSSLYNITYIYSTQAASSTTTGALQVSGGVGISGNVFTGGIVDISSTAASTSTSTGALIVDGGAGIAGNLNVGDRLIIGDTTPLAGVTTTGQIITSTVTAATPVLSLRVSSSAGNPIFGQFTSSGTPSAPTIVADGRGLGRNNWYGYDGSNYIIAASMIVSVDGTPGLNDMPGRITFATTADGASSPTERVRINNAGNVGIGNTNPLHTLSVGGDLFGVNITSTANVVVAHQLRVNSSNFATAIVNSGTAGVGNIGASGQGFNTVFARATSAQYADVAERYLADADYAPGTVLHFGGSAEVSQCNVDHCSRIAGVVSTNPAYIMNDSLTGEHVVDLALLGRVPCQVQGPVRRGDMMVSAGNGRARAEANPRLGAVIGKALQDFDGTEGVIEVVVGRV